MEEREVVELAEVGSALALGAVSFGNDLKDERRRESEARRFFFNRRGPRGRRGLGMAVRPAGGDSEERSTGVCLEEEEAAEE